MDTTTTNSCAFMTQNETILFPFDLIPVWYGKFDKNELLPISYILDVIIDGSILIYFVKICLENT